MYTRKIIQESGQESNENPNSAVASAISAGLGALTFRNHIRAINEQTNRRRLAKGAGIAGGVGAAGAGGGSSWSSTRC